MRTIREVLRLYFDCNLSQRKIAASLNIPRSTIQDYLKRMRALGLSWPLSEDLCEEKLTQLLYPIQHTLKRAHPDWQRVHTELKRKGVTLQLLWEEYQADQPNSYSYSWFTHSYSNWAKSKAVWMPQTHQAGEELYVDYSGLTIDIWDIKTQTVLSQAEIFVGALGASQKTFCRAYANQKLKSWIEANCDCLEFFNGVPKLIIPDNLRSSTTHAHIYEPRCNRTYEEMAQHYSCAIMPARSRRPKDKAIAEKAVQDTQRQILAKLRHHKFYSITEVNEAILPHLETYNNKPFQKLSVSRQQLYEQLDQPALQPLPVTRYEYAHWVKQTVKGNYHIEINSHHYSVPYQYVRKVFDIRITARTVECFYQDRRVASHRRDDTPGKYSTISLHQPEAHRQHTVWNQTRLINWSESIGPESYKFVNRIFTHLDKHIRQKERVSLGILRLSHAYGESRFEKACQYANEIGSCSFESLHSILKKGIDLVAKQKTLQSEEDFPNEHINIRGAGYYH